MMYILKKSIRLHQVAMMIKDCRLMTELHRILIEQVLEKYVKLKYKNINFDDYTNENKTEHNLKWPYIPDHPYRILIIRGSGSGKANVFHLIY